MNLKHGGNVFAIAEKHGWRWQEIADFSASINPLGPSPAVTPAIHNAISRIVHYPEAEPAALRGELAEQWGVPADCIMLGNGATELIYFLARILRPPKVTLAVPVFSEFHRAFPDAICRTGLPACPGQASRPVQVSTRVSRRQAGEPAQQHCETKDLGLLVVSRPANPTGQLPDLEETLRSTTNPMLVDESFIEFTEQPSLAPTVEKRENLYILRSLTKFYALPGLRVGALIAAAPTVNQWRERREPWQVNVLAEAAARAAIADTDHCRMSLDYIRVEREWLQARLSTLSGVKPQPSLANYLLIALDYPADRLTDHLLQAKILVRDCSGWPGVPFPHAIRIAVRTREENERLIEAWKGFECAQ